MGTNSTPLARRLRPKSFEGFIGHEDILGNGSILRNEIQKDMVPSIIMWGPPGCGKTSLANIIVANTKRKWVAKSATDISAQDLKGIIAPATPDNPTMLVIDDIHILTKTHTQKLLQAVEEGSIILIASTNDNPYFVLPDALLSRCQLIRFDPLNDEAMEKIIDKAIVSIGAKLPDSHEDNPVRTLINLSGGDARTAIATLEAAVSATPILTSQSIREILNNGAKLRMDRQGTEHYGLVKAWIQSTNGSDPQASTYWLARMLAAGEDPRFIARRMMILASEDIGLADSQALILATSALQAVSHVGMPEARIILGHVSLYLALAPKSNSAYKAINAALADVRDGKLGEVPKAQRVGSYPGAKALGDAEGYLYPHNFGGWVEQQYLPDQLIGEEWYAPINNGYEPGIVEKWNLMKDRSTENKNK